MAKVTQLRVELDGIALTAAQSQRLNQAVQKAVVAELALIVPKGGVRWRFPREWLGIWIGRIPEDVRTPVRTRGPR